jgi:hypothetical protein
MGGNQFKNYPVQRICDTIYHELKCNIIQLFQNSDINLYFFQNLPGKETHGDLDILYVTALDHSDILNIIHETLNPIEISSNGIKNEHNVLVSYKNDLYQIDFINCPSPELVPNYLFYGSFSDIGMIIGTILSAHGLSFGHEGLFVKLHLDTANLYLNKMVNSDECDHLIPLRIKNAQSNVVFSSIQQNKILLSSNLKEICDYLGADLVQWEKIKTLEDITAFLDNIRFNDNSYLQINNKKMQKRCLRPFFSNYMDYRRSVNCQQLIVSIPENQLQSIRDFAKIDELNDIILTEFHKKQMKTKNNITKNPNKI